MLLVHRSILSQCQDGENTNVTHGCTCIQTRTCSCSRTCTDTNTLDMHMHTLWDTPTHTLSMSLFVALYYPSLCPKLLVWYIILSSHERSSYERTELSTWAYLLPLDEMSQLLEEPIFHNSSAMFFFTYILYHFMKPELYSSSTTDSPGETDRRSQSLLCFSLLSHDAQHRAVGKGKQHTATHQVEET